MSLNISIESCELFTERTFYESINKNILEKLLCSDLLENTTIQKDVPFNNEKMWIQSLYMKF